MATATAADRPRRPAPDADLRHDPPMHPDDPDADLFDPDFVDPEAVELPITDVLDLHSFAPKEVKDVVRDWLDAAYEAGLRRVRIIHGRGVGVQRATVRALLERDPRVRGFGDAPAGAGGWGATWVELE
jgi:dsDNA-specific endonuclease/ATPase MutS2